jgi:hypothetical protein
MKDHREREADQRSGKRPTENDDDGMVAHEQVAAHEHERHDDGRPGSKAKAR